MPLIRLFAASQSATQIFPGDCDGKLVAVALVANLVTGPPFTDTIPFENVFISTNRSALETAGYSVSNGPAAKSLWSDGVTVRDRLSDFGGTIKLPRWKKPLFAIFKSFPNSFLGFGHNFVDIEVIVV